MAIRKTKSRRTSPKARKTTPRRASNGGNQWTRQEVAFLRKYYRKHETSWCARQLGRTVYSVRYKASDLSIKKASPSVWKGQKAGNVKPAVAKTSRTRKTTTRKTTKTRWASTKKRTTRKAKSTKRKTTRKAKPASRKITRKAKPVRRTTRKATTRRTIKSRRR